MSKSLIDRISEAADYVRAQAPDLSPDVGIIFGTGLSSLRTDVEDAITIPYGDIPHFVTSTVESHAGEMMLGTLEGRTVVAMRGRFHAYEGYTFQDITFPVRVMKALGINTLIVSNACGGLNPQWSKGDIMVIEDHINLMGGNPLVGCNDEALGPRFPDMCEPYTRELMELAIACATEEGLPVQKGVYVSVLGPNLETRAEYRMLRTLGADVVGMSTIPEVIVAVHSGLKVLGFSIITDSCLPDALVPVSLPEILQVAGEAEPKLNRLVKAVLRRL
ncbi:MAG: purine-nucleoside phosphorylase [Planctomycetes bacterium]|nr:purine-nucleoside phosphorylase [Planctomycetota bacterium]